MNILHVIDQLSMTHGGGAAKMAYQLAEAQARMGHSVAIYTTDWHLNGQRPEGVKVKAFKLWGSPFGLRVAPGMIFKNAYRGTVVHLHNYRTFPNLCFSIQGVPYVVEAHGSMPTTRDWPDSVLWKPLIFKGASAYIANSELEIPQYQDSGAKPDKITVIPPGIDWREFETLPTRRPMPYKTILSLGRLHPIKGVDLLIEAFQRLKRPAVRLVIAGNTEDTAYLTKLKGLAGSNKRIEFAGPLYGRDKLQAYVDADLYVLPSRYEMFGVTVLEALACGCPVVVMEGCGAAVNGLPRYLGAVSPVSVQVLTETITAMLDTDTLGGPSCRREWARDYGWDRLAQRHIKVYEGAMK